MQVSSALFLASLSPLTFPLRPDAGSLRHPLHHSAHGLRHPALRRVPRRNARQPRVSHLSRRWAGFLFWWAAFGPLAEAVCQSGWGWPSASPWAAPAYGYASRFRGIWPLVFVECALHFTTALLVFYVFRRFSPGTLLSGLGFMAWSFNIGVRIPYVMSHPALHLSLLRLVSMGTVVAAVGNDPPGAGRSSSPSSRPARNANAALARNWRLTPELFSPAAGLRTSTARQTSSARPWWPTAVLRRRR